MTSFKVSQRGLQTIALNQLKRGNRPLVVSLEKLSLEDTALREIAEGKITYELATAAELARVRSVPACQSVHKSDLNRLFRGECGSTVRKFQNQRRLFPCI